MKKWYQSKTIWANVIAIIAIALNSKYGIVLDAATQAEMATTGLVLMNIVLRIFTKQPVTK